MQGTNDYSTHDDEREIQDPTNLSWLRERRAEEQQAPLREEQQASVVATSRPNDLTCLWQSTDMQAEPERYDCYQQSPRAKAEEATYRFVTGNVELPTRVPERIVDGFLYRGVGSLNSPIETVCSDKGRKVERLLLALKAQLDRACKIACVGSLTRSLFHVYDRLHRRQLGNHLHIMQIRRSPSLPSLGPRI